MFELSPKRPMLASLAIADPPRPLGGAGVRGRRRALRPGRRSPAPQRRRPRHNAVGNPRHPPDRQHRRPEHRTRRTPSPAAFPAAPQRRHRDRPRRHPHPRLRPHSRRRSTQADMPLRRDPRRRQLPPRLPPPRPRHPRARRGQGRPEGPARFWGLVIIVSDLEALSRRLADHLGPIKPAVQPGRQIATLREGAGLSEAVAFMSPES